MPFGGHSDQTDAQIRWQIFTSLAYGAKGVLYFCYWSPAGPGMFDRGGGVIYPRGPMGSRDVLFKKGAHYEGAPLTFPYIVQYVNGFPTVDLEC